jgi:two-component system chemotaxis response regulator CheY
MVLTTAVAPEAIRDVFSFVEDDCELTIGRAADRAAEIRAPKIVPGGNSAPDRRGGGRGAAGSDRYSMRTLIVEDDFACRLVLNAFLSRYGECHIAVNGREAVEAFGSALERGQGYDLICMDIMMPEMDGAEAVRQIRAMEEAAGILSNYGAKIVMTTAVDDIKSVAKCFQDLCDGYLVKPIDLAKLLGLMKSYQLVQ